MSNIDSIVQIQIENKAYYLKTKLRSSIDKNINCGDLDPFLVVERKIEKIRKIFEQRRKPKFPTFGRPILSTSRITNYF